MKKKRLLILSFVVSIFSLILMSFISSAENEIFGMYELLNIEVLSTTEVDEGAMVCRGAGTVECNGEKAYKAKIVF